MKLSRASSTALMMMLRTGCSNQESNQQIYYQILMKIPRKKICWKKQHSMTWFPLITAVRSIINDVYLVCVAMGTSVAPPIALFALKKLVSLELVQVAINTANTVFLFIWGIKLEAAMLMFSMRQKEKRKGSNLVHVA